MSRPEGSHAILEPLLSLSRRSRIRERRRPKVSITLYEKVLAAIDTVRGVLPRSHIIEHLMEQTLARSRAPLGPEPISPRAIANIKGRRITLSVTLSQTLLTAIDDVRGSIPRSRWIEQMILLALASHIQKGASAAEGHHRP